MYSFPGLKTIHISHHISRMVKMIHPIILLLAGIFKLALQQTDQQVSYYNTGRGMYMRMVRFH